MKTRSLPRLFVAGTLAAGVEVELSAPRAHYLLRVLRLSEGAALLCFNGRDGEWRAAISTAPRGSCHLRLLQRERDQTAPQDLPYLFAPLKHARLDYLVQKAVEMGVSALQPVMTARTVAARVNADRMHANAIEAAEQCGILTIPEIRPAARLASLLEGWDETRMLIFCDEQGASSPPLRVLESVGDRKCALLVGPEGGFAGEERQALIARNYVRPISLGPRIMRADTAAVAALALVNAVLGDWR